MDYLAMLLNIDSIPADKLNEVFQWIAIYILWGVKAKYELINTMLVRIHDALVNAGMKPFIEYDKSGDYKMTMSLFSKKPKQPKSG